MTIDPDGPMPRQPSEPGPREQRSELLTLLARRVAIGTALFAIFALMAVMVYTILVVRQTQVSNTIKGDRNAETLRIVKDCTTPGGKCYTRGQKQTAHAVGSINRVIVLASACAVGLDPKMPVRDRQAAIQSCVVDRLAAQTSP